MTLSPAKQAEELLRDLLERLDHTFRPWEQSAPNQPALIGEGIVWTYGQLPGIVDGAAAELATGGANVALIRLLAHHRPEADLVLARTIGQGFDMGRPSILEASAEKKAGKVTATHIGGRCVAWCLYAIGGRAGCCRQRRAGATERFQSALAAAERRAICASNARAPSTTRSHPPARMTVSLSTRRPLPER